MNFIYLLIGFGVGYWLGKGMAEQAPAKGEDMNEVDRKIMEYLEAQGSIANNDVERLLDVSDVHPARL